MAVVRYLVNDVDVAVDFYCARLGFTVKERWGKAFAIVVRDDLTLWLSGLQSSAARPMPDGNKPVPGGWNRLVITVVDIEAMADSLKNDGVRLRSEVVAGPGGRQLVIEDPAGITVLP